jgi:hypothetical protein
VTNFFSPDHDVSVHLGLGTERSSRRNITPSANFRWGLSAATSIGRSSRSGQRQLPVGTGSVSLLLGQGDGHSPRVRYATGLLPDFLLARDFDRDGRLDTS